MIVAANNLNRQRTDSRTDGLDGRQRILLSAAQLFLVRGYAETSLRTIAESADMQPASIYHHFESKDALLTEILEIGMKSVMTAFVAVNDDLPASADGPTRLRAHIAGHLRALFANQAFTAAHVTVFPFVPSQVRFASVPERDAYEALWTDLLTSIAPDLDDHAIRLVRLGLLGAMNSTLQWFDPSMGSLDDLASNFVSTLWNGLGQNGVG